MTLNTYMALSGPDALDRVKALMRTVRHYNGVFSILWHNSSFDGARWEGYHGVYESILAYGASLRDGEDK